MDAKITERQIVIRHVAAPNNRPKLTFYGPILVNWPLGSATN